MTMRTRERTVTFRNAFVLEGIGYSLPPGDYRVNTDEELIEGISFPVYRRIATMIFVPGQMQRSSIEMVTIDPAELTAALARDAAAGAAAQKHD